MDARHRAAISIEASRLKALARLVAFRAQTHTSKMWPRELMGLKNNNMPRQTGLGVA